MTTILIKKIYLPKFKKVQIFQAEKELELIIAHFTKKSREFILAHPELKINPSDLTSIKKAIKKRIAHCPLAYITGEREFFGLRFWVTPATLIPRPETELLVERALEILKKNPTKNWQIYEIGTGSGAIAISLVKNFPNGLQVKSFIASDNSFAALKIATKNARAHKVNELIAFKKADLMNFLVQDANAFNPSDPVLILANLPYVSQSIFTNCSADIREYEPTTALVSGIDGLDHYRQLFNQLQILKSNLPKTSFQLLIEHSPEQKKLLETKLIPNYLSSAKTSYHQDLAGRWRLTEISI